jgi:hypothetical protein
MTSPLAGAFSARQAPGQATASCAASPAGAAAQRTPCNLQWLQTTREKTGEDHHERVDVRLEPGVSPNLLACPVQLPAHEPLQLIAPSSGKRNTPARVAVTVATQAVCAASWPHPQLVLEDRSGERVHVGTSATLEFFLPPRTGVLGWRDALRRRPPTRYRVQAQSCGVPASANGRSIASLARVIEVYPADQYALSLSLPALKDIERGKTTERWKSENERRLDAAAERAAADFDKPGSLAQREGYSRDWYVESARSFEESAIEIERGVMSAAYVHGTRAAPRHAKLVGGAEVSFTITDGNKSLEIDASPLLKLYQLARDAEAQFKAITEWWDGLQIGWGASAKLDCSFLALQAEFTWGYCEVAGDPRVHDRWSGSFSGVLLEGSIALTGGWRLAGVANAVAEIRAEGSIGLQASVESLTPLKAAAEREATLTPTGELTVSAAVRGKLAWTIELSAEVKTTFTADCSAFSLRSEGGPMRGVIVIKRSPVVRSYRARFAGVSQVGEDEATAIEGDDQFAVFSFV